MTFVAVLLLWLGGMAAAAAIVEFLRCLCRKRQKEERPEELGGWITRNPEDCIDEDFPDIPEGIPIADRLAEEFAKELR